MCAFIGDVQWFRSQFICFCITISLSSMPEQIHFVRIQPSKLAIWKHLFVYFLWFNKKKKNKQTKTNLTKFGRLYKLCTNATDRVRAREHCAMFVCWQINNTFHSITYDFMSNVLQVSNLKFSHDTQICSGAGIKYVKTVLCPLSTSIRLQCKRTTTAATKKMYQRVLFGTCIWRDRNYQRHISGWFYMRIHLASTFRLILCSLMVRFVIYFSVHAIHKQTDSDQFIAIVG